jgi:hypothetical protein
VELQRDVGVLGCVRARVGDAHLVEFDLLRAATADFGVRDRLDVEMPPREVVEVVRPVCLEHVRLEQRIVRDAAQLQTVIREHVLVVFDVLPHLLARGVGEPRRQACERFGERQLVGSAWIAMGERNVAGDTGRDREREADELRAHRIETRRFAIERDELRTLDLAQPPLEGRSLGHDFVLPRHRRRRIGRRRTRIRMVEGRVSERPARSALASGSS